MKTFKDCVVAGGHRQIYQQNYDNVYAPVVNFISCVLLFILAFILGGSCEYADVTAALLKGILTESCSFKFHMIFLIAV